MFLLILESLGSTELLFILVMALIFFGPRKLPQMSRKLGKSLAEFRRASEDFKSTWEREVALESPPTDQRNSAAPDPSLLSNNQTADQFTPTIRVVSPDEQVPRETNRAFGEDGTATEYEADPAASSSAQKRDWL